MIPAITSATAGLTLATLRLERSARSIAASANAASGARVYILAPADRLTAALRTHPTDGAAMRPVTVSAPTWLAAQEAFVGSGPMSDAQKDANMIDAVLEQTSASLSFRANARVLTTSQDMVKQLFYLAD
jgi:hypothetical protein